MYDPIPCNYVVKYFHHGEPRQFITLERSRAEQYAMEHHGTVHTAHLWIDSSTPAKNDSSKEMMKIIDVGRPGLETSDG